MKKIALFFGAFAMLAFASCNKEEGMVKLTLEGEQYTSTEKQSYLDNQVYFDANDQVLVNGVPATLTPTDQGRKATLTADYSANGYDIVYGHGVTYQNGEYFATFAPSAKITPIDGLTTLSAQHRPMVMYSFMHDVDDNTDDYAGHNHFMLKHACSFLAPSIKYGRWWADFMWNNGNDAVDPWPGYTTDGEMPTLELVGVEVTSQPGQNCMPLSGVAKLNRVDFDHPEMNMVIETLSQDNALRISCRDANGHGLQAPIYTSTGDLGRGLGQIPVCPDYTAGHTAKVKFHIEARLGQETRYYIYKGTFTLNNENSRLVRGTRFFLVANFFNQQNTSTASYRTRICRVENGDYQWYFED